MLIREVVEDMARADDLQKERQKQAVIRNTVLLPLLLLILLASAVWPIRRALVIPRQTESALVTAGIWRSHPDDLVYTVAFST